MDSFSPHILIDQYLDTVESPSCPELYEVIAVRNITRLRDEGRITLEEFTHYSARLRRICEQRKEAA